MEKYQKNAIKSIYGNGTLDNLLTVSDAAIKNFYEYTHRINSNGIEVTDKICTVNSYHGFSSYTVNVNDDAEIYPLISYNNYKYLYKLLNAKDIDWDNAYLRYLSVQDYDQPYNEAFSYSIINPETGKVFDTTYFCYDYVFDKYLCNNSYTINSTYELLNIIDYLFTRYNTLKFALKNVLSQREAKSEYIEVEQSQIEVTGD